MASILEYHMSAKEHELAARGRVPANSGHPLHKGTPREVFVKEFLEAHLPYSVAIGTGEIIDHRSQPSEQRNQFDIVLYKSSYPKIDVGGNVSAFLVESVIATIEVKSNLGKDGLYEAMKAAKSAKSLEKKTRMVFETGYRPPKIINYVLAYDGPASMETIHGWIPEHQEKLGIQRQPLPQEHQKRMKFASESIDGVFVLEKGFVHFDNVPFGFVPSEARKKYPQARWVILEASKGSLLTLFLYLQYAATSLAAESLDHIPYLGDGFPGKLKLGGA